MIFRLHSIKCHLLQTTCVFLSRNASGGIWICGNLLGRLHRQDRLCSGMMPHMQELQLGCAGLPAPSAACLPRRRTGCVAANAPFAAKCA